MTFLRWLSTFWTYQGPQGYPYVMRRLLALHEKEQGMKMQNRGIPKSIVITSKPRCSESWWLGKSREDFYRAWRERLPHMKLTKATAFTSGPSGIEIAE